MHKGIVVATHPSDYSVDVLLSDGRRLVGVQVMAQSASARSGTFNLPAVPPRADKWDVSTPNGQDQIAIVEFVGGVPLVVGFLFPQISQMTFDDPKMRVARHQSDVMSVIDGDGNMQITHPAGAFVRLGETPDAVDMAAANTDGNLALDRNTGRSLYLRVVVPGAIDLKVTPDGQLTLTLGQGAVIDAPDGITLNTPLVSVPNGDVVASGVSLVNHVHGATMPGPGTTGMPVA